MPTFSFIRCYLPCESCLHFFGHGFVCRYRPNPETHPVEDVELVDAFVGRIKKDLGIPFSVAGIELNNAAMLPLDSDAK